MKYSGNLIYIFLSTMLLFFVSACATAPSSARAPHQRPSINPAARGTEELRGKLAEGGKYVLGKKELVIRGKRFNMDCTGTVLAIYYYAGIDLARDFNKYTGNGVMRLYKSLDAEELLYETRFPVTGDIIFWDNTYDRNQDRQWNDPLTHVGMVMNTSEDGSIEYVHLNYRRGIIIENMNLHQPEVHQQMEKGQMRIINSPMRMKQAGKAHPDNWLSGQLFKIFGMGYLF
ncbi:MAG: CHAP domain-containing protein [Spirochaetaceae bacterium]|nr:MAG: CHAP domain-containing protein [Spirochaetaceae bacterium]